MKTKPIPPPKTIRARNCANGAIRLRRFYSPACYSLEMWVQKIKDFEIFQRIADRRTADREFNALTLRLGGTKPNPAIDEAAIAAGLKPDPRIIAAARAADARSRGSSRPPDTRRWIADTRRWKCRGCGCTEKRACPGACCWVEKNLCENCLAWSDNFTPAETLAIWELLLAVQTPRASYVQAILDRMAIAVSAVRNAAKTAPALPPQNL
jgi:hypothetical protein